MTIELTVVLTRYNEPDSMIFDCITSITKQTIPLSLIYYEQQLQNTKVKNFLRKTNLGNIKKFKFIIAKTNVLSKIKNFGIKESKTNYISFLDPDHLVDKNWAKELIVAIKKYKKDNVAIAGSKVILEYERPPKWYHKATIMYDFYSGLDLKSNKIIFTDRVLSQQILDKNLLGKEAYFSEELGRQNGILLGGEETDLADRTTKKGLKIIYVPTSMVIHRVSSSRMEIKWILKRVFYAGISRAKRGGMINPINKKKNIYDKLLLPIISGPYFCGFILTKLGWFK